jgi:hypothetical protein
MRYGLTQYDVMNNDGDQMSLTYAGSIGNFDVVASKWSNDYHRDWFKVDQANNSGITNADGTSIGTGINNVISAANGGSTVAQGILDGTVATEVKLKHNNRYYTNEGIQFKIMTEIGMHALTFGYTDIRVMSVLIKAQLEQIQLFPHVGQIMLEVIID